MKKPVRPMRYTRISAHPNTQAECDRIDGLAREADRRWEEERAAKGRLTDAQAAKLVRAQGWHLERDHRCDRTKTRRACRIRVACTIYTKVGTYTLPGLGSGRSLAEAVTGSTWEQALKLARCKVKLAELDRRAEGRRYREWVERQERRREARRRESKHHLDSLPATWEADEPTG